MLSSAFCPAPPRPALQMLLPRGAIRTTHPPLQTKFYPTEDVAVPKANHKHAKPATLRASITPGTVLILLSGRFRGKRVVFLKQLESGLLLVTGPYSVNGVPLKRVDQVYVIATSTKIDVSGISLPAALVDATFARPAGAAKSGDFYEKQEEAAKTVDPARLALQKEVDTAVAGAIGKADPLVKDYLRSLFTLRKGQYPHELVF